MDTRLIKQNSQLAASNGRSNFTRPQAPQQYGQFVVDLPTGDQNPDDFTITCDNSSGGSDVVYLVGDPSGAQRIFYGGSFGTPTYNYQGLTAATLNAYMTNGMLFKMTGFVMTTTNDSAQFSAPFDVVSGIYNNFKKKSIINYLNRAQNPMALNALQIQPIFGNGIYLPLDFNNSWYITVLAGYKLTLQVTIGKASEVLTTSLIDTI